jgi:hypothetical protein
LEVIHKYATKSKDILSEKNKTLFDEITAISALSADSAKQKFESEYDALQTPAGSRVEVLDIDLYIAKKEAMEQSLKDSDFVINSEIYSGIKPLVLKSGIDFGKDFKYIRGPFDPNTPVPNFAPGSWEEEREMPGKKNVKGRYLTVSDLLEPYLIKTIYPISDKFYGYKFNDEKKYQGYLLPLKKEFFQFFTLKDLEKGETGERGKPKLSIVPQGNGDVKVALKIPIQKNYDITFEKTYKNGDLNQEPNEEILDGGIIVQAKIGVAIFPFVKIGEDGIVSYRVQLVDSDKDLQHVDYELEFYVQKSPKSPFGKGIVDDRFRFDKKKGYQSSSYYYRTNKEFDLIQFSVKNSKAKALIIPMWPPYVKGTVKNFTFAVDFGTTNTYMAYKENDNADPHPFDLKDVTATLFDTSEKLLPKSEENIRSERAGDIIDLIDKEFVPLRIGKENDSDDNIFSFPQRTAIAYNKDLAAEGWTDGEGLDALMEGNIPFGYEKTQQRGNQIDTNLKWNTGKDQEAKEKTKAEMETYLREAVMLMQAKVLRENCDLEKSSLIWFYPSSMGFQDKCNLEETWRSYFKKYFFKGKDDFTDQETLDGHFFGIMEALAPFYAKADKEAFAGGAVVSVDIGGGTTDVAVFLNPTKDSSGLKATTSFKFAGNAIFGDGNNSKSSADKSGFIIRYAKKFEDLLKDYPEPRDILAGLRDPKKSATAADINAFLFSIENSIEFWAKDQNTSAGKNMFSYTRQLQQSDDLKFLVIYFYVALLWHIAKVLKHIKIDKVQYLMFSGTASKMLNILGIKPLKDLTKEIFNRLELINSESDLKIIPDPKPKEVTCNGGLMAPKYAIDEQTKSTQIAKKSIVYTCIKGKEFDKEATKFSEYIEDVSSDDSNIKAVLVEFHKFFFELSEDSYYGFKDYFGINNDVIMYFKNNYMKLINFWLKDSITKNDDGDAGAVPETPFFMPLKSIILELSERIIKKDFK